MTKTCIICGQLAGSGEHIFPAVFGGRRTNKGIYCQKHNNEFGRHVSAILDGLDIVNALVGVIPDRRQDVRPALATGPDGTHYLVTANEVHLAPPPPLDETPELVGRRLSLDFASREQAEQWIADQEKAGYRLGRNGFTSSRKKYFGSSVSAQRTLGDEPFMRGLLYVALTFLAHNYPKLARSDGLAEVRTIVEKDGPVGDRVLWEPDSSLSQISLSPFVPGHTVATGPSADHEQVISLISLYGAVQFGIFLGSRGEQPRLLRTTTHINPLARHPPNDIQVVREDAALTLSTVTDSKSYLRQLRTGEINPFARLLRDAGERELMAAAKAMMFEIRKLESKLPEEKILTVTALVAEHSQRIFSWMRIRVLEYVGCDDKLSPAMRHALQTYVSVDDSSPNGLTRESGYALLAACNLLAGRIVEDLNDGVLDHARLGSIIGGGEEGVRTVLVYLALRAKGSRH
ncbi:hypothetical protein [Burkholderia gladioli]|uniref:hypothetical protein n=1 Tax=Burkholderia gladioli TaxID=28095 RepID=UPI00163ECB45|nr:hypothetical protein [Burkholderia gladioli]